MSNIAIASGNLADDAKLFKNKAEGRDMLVFTVSDNGPNDTVEHVSVVVWGANGFADKVTPILTKGYCVKVKGQAIITETTEKDGVVYENYFVELKSLFGLKLLGKPARAGQQPAEPENKPDAPQGQTPENIAKLAESQPQPAPDYDSFDDDIPF